MELYFSLILDTLFGAFEIFSVVVVAGALFRMPYIKDFIGISILVSILNTVNLSVLMIPFFTSEVIALLFTFMLHIFILKMSKWHSFLMTAIGYIVAITIQTLLVLTFQPFGFTAEDAVGHTMTTYFYQLVQFIVLAPASLFIYRKGIGIVLLNENMDSNDSNIFSFTLVFSVLTGVVTVIATVYALVTSNPFTHMYFFLSIILLNALLILLYRKSKREHEKHYKDMNIDDIIK